MGLVMTLIILLVMLYREYSAGGAGLRGGSSDRGFGGMSLGVMKGML